MKNLMFVFLSIVVLMTGCASPEAKETLGNISNGITAGMNAFLYLGDFHCDACHHNSEADRKGAPASSVHGNDGSVEKEGDLL